MNIIQKVKAGELSLALSWGQADLSEAVDWADEQITLADEPDNRLFDVSLSKSASDAVSHLNYLSEDMDFWLTVSHFLNRFYSLKMMSPSEASKLAESLYYLAFRDDAPAYFEVFTSHWDAIDLAIDGYYGDPTECVRDFLKDIKEAVVSGGGPTFKTDF